MVDQPFMLSRYPKELWLFPCWFFLHYVQNVQDNVCGPDEGAQS